MSNELDVEHKEFRSPRFAVRRFINLHRYQQRWPLIVLLIVSCLILLDFSRFIPILTVLTLGSLVCVVSRSIIPILYIFLLGMFAFNRDFAYLSLHIGSVPLYVTEIVLALFLLKSLLLSVMSRKIKEVKTPLDIPFALYYTVGALLLLRDLPKYSIAAVRDFVLVYYSLFFYVITENIRSFKDIQRVIKICLIGGILSAAFFVGKAWLPHVGPVLRMLLPRSNVIGHCTHIIPSAILFVALRDYLARKRLLLIIACIQIVTIVLSMVRSAWIALAGSLAFLLIISKGQRKFMLSVVASVFASVLILIWAYGHFINPMLLRDLYMEGKSIYDYNMPGASAANALWRIETTKVGLRVALQHPLGVGFGSPAAEMVWASRGDPESDYHNSALSILVRTGFLGFLMFFCINAMFYYHAIRFCMNTQEALHRAYMVGILAGHLSISINALFFMVLQGPYMGVFYWIFMGLGIALINVGETPQTWESESPCL